MSFEKLCKSMANQALRMANDSLLEGERSGFARRLIACMTPPGSVDKIVRELERMSTIGAVS